MKKMLLETKFSKIYMLVIIILTLLIVGGYFSYAIFTVSKEKNNAISIVTGNLTYDLKIDGASSNTLSVNSGETKEFTVTLSNPNSRIARFNFYYIGALPDGVSAGYVTGDGFSTPPLATGVNLEANGSVGASNVYKIRVTNNSGSNAIVTLGVQVGLDYNDLALPSNGHLFEEMSDPTVAEILLTGVGENGAIDTTDKDQTFITGTDPNNYIWYSGKLWRAVSIDTSDNSVKLVSQDNISTLSYNQDGDGTFVGSYIEMWLNDTTESGFLANLRSPEKFLKMDSKWVSKRQTGVVPYPDSVSINPVGLLTAYEYTKGCGGKYSSTCYLNNGLYSWILSENTLTNAGVSSFLLNVNVGNDVYAMGVRPAINLKPTITISSGTGTNDDPYRLEGDNDTNLSGTLLNTRFSGEYIRFGIGENNLYRIVSHENGGTKITTDAPLKNNGADLLMEFGDSSEFYFNAYGISNTIHDFLNNTFYKSTLYLSTDQKNMVQPTRLYIGTVGMHANYLLAKYKDTSMSTEVYLGNFNVGLLRVGELMAGQNTINDSFWLITPYQTNELWVYLDYTGFLSNSQSANYQHKVKPTLTLKDNVVITDGVGIKSNPFVLTLNG